ncbi:MAG TPA: DUF6580 family putative transport protein [Candidatus Saccharimonadales bacterium]|nr:DUF6580 family putative transport protein [Candidatus Saccharimonadales bacterium]
MRVERVQLGLALCLIAIGVGLRLLPHPANFAPIAAIALFGGAVLPRRLAVVVPVVAMMVSDLFIGFYSMMPVTWGCYALIALASSHWLRRPNVVKGTALTLGSSLFFFVVTNFAVWLTSGMYAHSGVGLARCYEMALPFFRNTALSDVLYTAGLFSLFGLANIAIRRRLVAPPTPS